MLICKMKIVFKESYFFYSQFFRLFTTAFLGAILLNSDQNMSIKGTIEKIVVE
jgi:hypothetical protein